MKKLKLNLGDLHVDSFEVQPIVISKGTIAGQEGETKSVWTCIVAICDTNTCDTVLHPTCYKYATCGITCDDTCPATCGSSCGVCTGKPICE